MTRSIVLRYPATCHDCGNQLEAGTTARWFGRGRVSCCGTPDATTSRRAPAPVLGSDPKPVHNGAANRVEVQRAVDAAELDAADPVIQARARLDALSTAQRQADARGYCNGFAKQELLRAHYCKAFLAAVADLPFQQPEPPAVEPAQTIDDALQQGLTPELLARVAASQPTLRLLVRLQSGARFIVPAEHCAHVIRCVEESCIDRVRDIMRAAQ